MESLTRDSEISKTGRTWLAWGWGGVSIARVEKGPVRDSDRLSSLKHVDHLPRCPSTTACRLHPASCQRAGNAAKAAHAACLNLPNDRHHIRRIPLGGRFVGRYRQRACSIKAGLPSWRLIRRRPPTSWRTPGSVTDPIWRIFLRDSRTNRTGGSRITRPTPPPEETTSTRSSQRGRRPARSKEPAPSRTGRPISRFRTASAPSVV